MLLLSVLRARVLLALLLLMLRTRLLSTLVLRTLLAIAIAPGAIRARSAMPRLPRLPRLRQSALRHVDARLRAVRELALDTFAVSIEVVERLAR